MSPSSCVSMASVQHAAALLTLLRWKVCGVCPHVADPQFLAEHTTIGWRRFLVSGSMQESAPWHFEFRIARDSLVRPQPWEAIYIFVLWFGLRPRCLVLRGVDLLGIRQAYQQRTGHRGRPVCTASQYLWVKVELDDVQANNATLWDATVALDDWSCVDEPHP